MFWNREKSTDLLLMWSPLPHIQHIFSLEFAKTTTTICKIYLPVNKEFTTVKLCFLS